MSNMSTWGEIGKVYGLSSAATKQLAYRRRLNKRELIEFLEKKGKRAPMEYTPHNFKDTARSAAKKVDAEILHKHHWSYKEEHYTDTLMLSVPDHHLLHSYLVYDEDTRMYCDYKGKLLTSKAHHIALLMYIKMA